MSKAFPNSSFVGVDLSVSCTHCRLFPISIASAVDAARVSAAALGLKNVAFLCADLVKGKLPDAFIDSVHFLARSASAWPGTEGAAQILPAMRV